jgi:hypothetical protein
MRNLGLSVPERKSAEALLQSHHTIDVVITLLDLDGNEVAGGDISGRLLDGQVTVDADRDVVRSLDIDLFDPLGALHLDSRSPDAGALFADRMIRVRYAWVNPAQTIRYSCPIFTGPLTKLDRNGVALQVECQGKEIFGLSPSWTARTFKKGYTVTTAIKVIVRDMMGENDFNIPDLAKKLPRNVSVGGDKVPWKVAKALAASIGYHLFFDGFGICQMRKMPKGVSFTFRDGPGGSIKTLPTVGFDLGNIVNAVEVWGKKPKRKKNDKTKPKRPHAKMVAPRSHPLSPWALGRKGGPRYLPAIIEDDSVQNTVEAKQRCRSELAKGLLESLDVSYDTLVIPHMEEMDVVRCSTQKFAANHRLKQFAIPLTASGDSTVGYVRNVKPNRSAIRHSRKKKH